jgi:hypothetical protein
LNTGTANIIVFARDEYGLTTNGFAVTVTPFNYPPTLAPIADQTTKAGVDLSIPLTVTDPDTAITSLSFSGSSTNAALVSSVTFAYNGTTEVATVHVVPGKSGTDRVTILVGDGTSTVGQKFNLTVTATTNPAPTLGVTLSNGQLHISLKGTANASYGLLTTSDFKTWTDTGITITADASGNATTTIPLPPQRFLFARTYNK